MAKMASSPFSFLQDSAVLASRAQGQSGGFYNISPEILIPERISTQAHSLRHELLLRSAGVVALADVSHISPLRSSN